MSALPLPLQPLGSTLSAAVRSCGDTRTRACRRGINKTDTYTATMPRFAARPTRLLSRLRGISAQKAASEKRPLIEK
jgi:hypothetical protein